MKKGLSGFIVRLKLDGDVILIVKRIVCDVLADKKTQFSQGQQEWRALAGQPGFAGQVGGWLDGDADKAVILGCWQDVGSYDRFMSEVHDSVFDVNGQKGTYSSGHVDRWQMVLPMPGERGSLSESIEDAGLIRIAHCRVKPSRFDHFIEVQQSIWNPGMASSGGMLAGAFNRHLEDETQFLVCTLWRSEADHRHYCSVNFPDLHRRAEVGQDCDDVFGMIVHIENAWDVAP